MKETKVGKVYKNKIVCPYCEIIIPIPFRGKKPKEEKGRNKMTTLICHFCKKIFLADLWNILDEEEKLDGK